jgi:acyl carrier protein
MSRATLESELKHLLVEALMLEGQEATDIDSDSPLFGEGLGLDSIDALELGMAISKRYGIEINAEDESVRTAFSSISALAEYVEGALGANS